MQNKYLTSSASCWRNWRGSGQNLPIIWTFWVLGWI